MILLHFVTHHSLTLNQLLYFYFMSRFMPYLTVTLLFTDKIELSIQIFHPISAIISFFDKVQCTAVIIV